ncbi:FAD-dependent oxidoreductase [Kutzneria viridogrisea]|uniref:NADPH-dependent 2,4-dienoyl-CoA reductase/sulfur reductase-like enzyme n=1 Tax=Kutzneria viridogrisea TaxID=47990 RepID=A0ABR6BJD2_9PSEU|nr:NADPH-dependent 2,4-dienoyl-CoA reductase/sulfur reductase-like enzyme [Kutzneria viridogrisea]
MNLDHVVVVGASAAGLTAAEALRREGYDGRITMIGAEQRLPYDRPPLSKQVLAGTWEPERTALRREDALVEADWLLGTPAAGLDVAARTVRLADGTAIGYDGLVIATGVTPRRLPFGHDLAGVHVLRSMDDALALRKDLLAASSVVVVGAGFLGAETAAVARQMGLAVTLVDPLPAPMIRQFGAKIGGLVAKLHADNGVTVRTGVGVSGLVGLGDQVVAVDLADGSSLPAEVVLVAIGSEPATGWLADSGLSLGNGVDCDSLCRAAPGVVAAGDVASWTHPELGVRLRVEHRMNATEQGMAAAKTLLGKGEPFAPVPYFWTDQYEVKIQAYGMFPEDSVPTVVVGDPAEGSFAAEYHQHGRVVGVLGWNLPRETRKLRARIGGAA